MSSEMLIGGFLVQLLPHEIQSTRSNKDMPITVALRKIFPWMILTVMLAGCAASASANPAQAVESYIKALVARDVNQVVNASCAAWEGDARQEFRAFDAVTVTLENLSCQVSSQEDQSAVVSCTGKIVANYGDEVLEINLADRDYHVLHEGGEWRMCGYR
jgi:hypothetical protein